MESRRYIFALIALLILMLSGIAGINYYIDPLWFYLRENDYNNWQEVIDERQQKTNFFYFGNINYDAILLGSSRTTYINQFDFKKNKVFNYAVSAMAPAEYSAYTAYAEEKQKKIFQKIFIGVDFFATNKNYQHQADLPENYFKRTERFLYRFETLLSIENWKRSFNNIKNTSSIRKGKNPIKSLYHRNNVKHLAFLPTEEKNERRYKDLRRFADRAYGVNYIYDENLLGIWESLHNAHSQSQIIIFTTPISAPLLQTLVESGRWMDYERWLRDMVSVFGSVYNFMGINSMTTNLHNYQDASHFYPSVGTEIVRILESEEEGSGDFGALVTKKNIDEHLVIMKHQIDAFIEKNVTIQ